MRYSPHTWSTKRLDALLAEMKLEVIRLRSDERLRAVPESESVAAVVAYWMAKLRRCAE